MVDPKICEQRGCKEEGCNGAGPPRTSINFPMCAILGDIDYSASLSLWSPIPKKEVTIRCPKCGHEFTL